LVVEPRTVERGYVAYTEDSFNVFGAGITEANGLYAGFNQGIGLYTNLSNNYTVIKVIEISPSRVSWEVRDDLGNSLYATEKTDPAVDIQAEPSNAFFAVDGEEPAPLVQPLSEIGEYIGHWNGEIWTCADSQRGQAYPDHNGIRIANCDHGDVVWVAHKKAFTDTYGDGTSGTVSDIPSEWLEFMSYDAARAYAASQGNQDGYNPVAIRDVDRAMERALMKVSRQGINETIALYFRTNYGYDVSVN
jgi:hypothetical protein